MELDDFERVIPLAAHYIRILPRHHDTFGDMGAIKSG
jgi:hypothetical protein